MAETNTRFPNARVTLRDVTTVESQEFGKCANCYENVDEDSACKTFQDEIAILSLFHIKVVDALTDIFELNKKLYLSSVRLDDCDLVLCFRCTNTLKKLYSFFVEFINSSNSPSFINSIVKFSPTFSRIKNFRNIQSRDTRNHFDPSIKLELVSSAGDLDEDNCEENELQVSSPGGPRIDHTSLVEVEYESDDFSDADFPDDLNTDPDYVQMGHLLQISESEYSDEYNDLEKSVGEGELENETHLHGSGASQNIATKATRVRHAATFKTKQKRDRSTKRYKCEICSEKFSRTDHVKRHMRCHSEKNFNCPVCSAGFKHQIRMEDHLKTHDPNYIPPPKPPKKLLLSIEGDVIKPVNPKPKKTIKGFTECEICGKTLPNRHNINLHLASHKGEADKTLVCEICGSTFKTNSALKTHQKFHGNTRDFLCKVCGVSFKRRQHLSEHESVKHGNQPRQYVCSEPNCNKAFHRLRNLRQHRKLHGNTKYACENGCGALFTFKYNRKVHQDKSCSKAPHLIKVNEERRAKCSKRMTDSRGINNLTSVEKTLKRRIKINSSEGTNQVNQPDTEAAFNSDLNLLSNSNSDNPINFSHCSLQHFARNPSNFAFNFSSPMFPLGMGKLDCLNLPQPASTSCDPSQHQAQFPGLYDRDKASINSSFNINALNRPVSDIQQAEFNYN